MPIFRAYCLDANGRINYGEDVDAPDLERVIDVPRVVRPPAAARFPRDRNLAGQDLPLYLG